MKRKANILLVILCLSLISYSQTLGYKYNVSKKVFERIVSAYGSNRAAPLFEIRPKNYPGKKQILMYYPGAQPKIVMDEEVYDLCVSLGADSLNAIASMLGHELAHHYEKHDWCSSFAYLLDEKEALRQKISTVGKDEKLRIEVEADYFGGFYGYVSGYSTFDISTKLLDKIYAYYKLPDNLKGYPSKEERKQIAKKSLKELEQYKAVFDVAEALTVLKEYESAVGCFEYLSDKFPSREMFGNTGFVKVLAAMDFVNEKEMPFVLPLELDAGTRLKTGAVRGGTSAEEKEKQKKILLEGAIKYFDKAIAIDGSYISASINKCCAYILLNNPDMAIGIVNEIVANKAKCNNRDLSKAYSIKGIALYIKGENENAQSSFDMAVQLSSISRNNYNLAVIKEMNKGNIDTFLDYVNSFFEDEVTSSYGIEKVINPSLEKIGGAVANQPLTEKGIDVQIGSGKQMQLSYLQKEIYKDLKIKSDKTYRVLLTNESYKGGTSQGITMKSSIEDVKLKYGEPTYTIDETKGIYLVYRKARIVFLLNQNNKVVKWFTYYI